MKFPRQAKPFTGRLDAAPFAGVFFLLLLFLLLQSSLVPVPGIRIHLPTIAGIALPGTTGPALTVAVDSRAQLYFNQQAVSERDLRDRLTAQLRRFHDPVTLVILADEAVDQGAVTRLCGLARELGIGEVVIGARAAVLPGGEATNVAPTPQP